jgi:hypothetical protein
MSHEAEEAEAVSMIHSGTSYQLKDVSKALEPAIDPPYPVTLNFKFQGREWSEQLLFKYPVDIPRPNDMVTFKFDDFGTVRRISGTVQNVIREFYGPGVVPNLVAGYIVQIFLIGVTEQPV